MDDRNNILAGWILAGGIAALGLSIGFGSVFHTEDPEGEKMGYFIEDTAAAAGEASGPPLATLLASSDVAHGETVFKKCAACHTVAAGGANGIGPNLHGVVGEAIGKGVGGYAFSDALASVGGQWTFDQMNAWLESPRKFAPGTKMTFAGLGDPQDRADVIAYLNTQGSNLPFPPPPAEGEGEDAAGESDAAVTPVDAAVGDGEPAGEANEAAAPAAPL
ncbi:MAG: cytochrome c family protein [Novosphingopyxis baekryungensis]|nr:cytochrome c family protein [Novosphingopyxis baekryungensis]